MSGAAGGQLLRTVLLLGAVAGTTSLLCSSPQCKKLAARMLAQMSHEEKACDNFYNFACGGLHNDPFLLEYDFQRDVHDRLKRILQQPTTVPEFQQFQTFYNSCVYWNTSSRAYEEEWARHAIAVLNDTGIFSGAFNFTKIFLGLLKYDSPMVFDLTLDIDDTNSSQFVIKMNVPERANPFIPSDHSLHDCYKNTANNGSALDMSTMYHDFIVCKRDRVASSVLSLGRVFQLLNETGLLNTSARDAALYQYQLSHLYEDIIDKTKASEQKRLLITRNYKRVTVKMLKASYRAVKWDLLLRELLGQDVPEDTPVHVYSMDYFNMIFKKGMSSSRKRGDLHNALLGSLLHGLYQNLVLRRLRDADYCVAVTSSLMEDVAAAIYLASFEPGELESTARGVQDLFLKLKDTLRVQLETASWLDFPSRAMLVSKLRDIHLELGSSQEVLKNMSTMEHDLAMDPHQYVKNSIALLQRRRRLMYSLFTRRPEDPHSIWNHFVRPQDTTSVFVYSLNLVAMPFGLAASPLCNQSLPRYAVMARLGAELSHLLAHHFNSIGLQYFGRKREGSWILSGLPGEFYAGMETCFDQQAGYAKTRRAPDGSLVEVDTSLSKEAQLADDIAVKLAYSLLQNSSLDEEPGLPFVNITNRQAFFLLLAQNFCSKQPLLSSAIALHEGENLPPFLRVSHIISNSKEFIEAFECPPSYPCEAFPYLTEESHEYYIPPFLPPVA